MIRKCVLWRLFHPIPLMAMVLLWMVRGHTDTARYEMNGERERRFIMGRTEGG